WCWCCVGFRLLRWLLTSGSAPMTDWSHASRSSASLWTVGSKPPSLVTLIRPSGSTSNTNVLRATLAPFQVDGHLVAQLLGGEALGLGLGEGGVEGRLPVRLFELHHLGL